MDEIAAVFIVLILYSGYLLFLVITHTKIRRLNLETQLSNNRLLQELENLSAENNALLTTLDIQTEFNQQQIEVLEKEILEKIEYIEKLVSSNDGLLLELKAQKSLNKNLTQMSLTLQNRIDSTK